MIIGMIKTLIVLVLILLVVGMYYRYDLTKEVMTVTGHVVADIGKKAIEEVKESGVLENATEKIKDKVAEKVGSEKEE